MPAGLACVKLRGEAIEQPVDQHEDEDDGDPVSADQHARGVEGPAVEDLGEKKRGNAEVDDEGHDDGEPARNGPRGDKRLRRAAEEREDDCQ